MLLLQTPITFDWDSGNKNKSFIRHSVSSQEIEEVFFNKPLLLQNDTKHSQIETRYLALGRTCKKRALFLSFTVRVNKIRVISARDMSKKERTKYEKHN